MNVLVLVFGRRLRIDPHVGRQIRMSVFHPFVHDGDDDFGITCRELPCVGHIDVGSGHRCSGNGLVGIVDVMPLPEKIRVVETKARVWPFAVA